MSDVYADTVSTMWLDTEEVERNVVRWDIEPEHLSQTVYVVLHEDDRFDSAVAVFWAPADAIDHANKLANESILWGDAEEYVLATPDPSVIHCLKYNQSGYVTVFERVIK